MYLFEDDFEMEEYESLLAMRICRNYIYEVRRRGLQGEGILSELDE